MNGGDDGDDDSVRNNIAVHDAVEISQVQKRKLNYARRFGTVTKHFISTLSLSLFLHTYYLTSSVR